MTTAIVRAPIGELARGDIKRAAELARAARASSTVRAYARAWKDFETYCDARGASPLPADGAFVAGYLAHLDGEGLTPSTIDLALAAIAFVHKQQGHTSPREDPRVRDTRRGIRRTRGTRRRRVRALVTTELRAMLAQLPEGLAGLRDRALLLLAFASGRRRGEIVALDVRDVRFVQHGMEILVRRSKTDQEGEGFTVGVHFGRRPETCPVRALRAWTHAAGIESGALFRGVNRTGYLTSERLSDRSVARIIKRAAERAGLPPGEYSGHSPRAGLATVAAARGVPLHEIATRTGHASLAVLRVYVREADLFARDVLDGEL